MKLSPTPRMRRAALALAVGSAIAVPGSVATAAVVIYGNPGPNTLRVTDPAGGTVRGDGGGDTIYGNVGPDQLYGETGPDKIYAAGGNDLLVGDTGDDLLDAGPGDDKVDGGFGHDTILGGDGADTIDGGPAPDKIDGGAGNDVLTGGSGSDEIDGGDGDDQIYASGPDVIQGGAGNDVVHVNTDVTKTVTARTVDCGPGNDTLILPSTGRAAGPAKFRFDKGGFFTNCENVLFQPEENSPTKGTTKNAGLFSNATLKGTDRNDVLNGSHGSNTIIGLAGDDQIYTDSTKITSAAIGRRAKKQKDQADGGAGNDFIIGGVGRNLLHGGTGDDQLRGGAGSNTIYGDDGNDAIRVAGKGTNKVFGGAGNDEITVATRRKAVVDCGPGEDTVRIGRVRPRIKNCEHQVSSYKN